jgi:hypothetical protein
VEATWYLFKIRPSIRIRRERDLIESDHLVAEVVKGVDGYTRTLVFLSNDEGHVLNWIPLVSFIGANYRKAIVDRLDYTLTLHRYPLKNVKGFIHDLLEDGRRATLD